MLRTTVYLDDEIALAVRQLAEVKKRKQADIIREALRIYIEREKSKGSRKALAGVGSYHSGHKDVSEQAEEILKQAARQGR